MKTLFKTFVYAAIAALALSSCAKENLQPADELTGKLVTVHFGTENTDPSTTRATLTPDAEETAFQAAWENGDVLSIEYISPKTATNKIIPATWDAATSSFSAELPNETGAWDFQACYPVPNDTDNSVDFGSARTQKGNAYNSKYDIMIGAASTENSAAGKDDKGDNIVFPMTRQTAIAYFHFTSDLNEKITSATLTVSGEGSAIASSDAHVSNFEWAPSKDCKSITITFPEEAPNAQDFKLWFNVLETSYESMSLTVESETKTFTISKASIGNYVAGKLYKVNKVASWTDKPATPSGPTITKISSTSDFTAGTYIIVTYDGTYYVPNAAAISDQPSLGNVQKSQSGVISITPEMIWNATEAEGGLEFTSYRETDKKLWGAPTNKGVRVTKTNTTSGASTIWKPEVLDTYGLCAYAGVSDNNKYYLSTYGTSDWRNYLSPNLKDNNKPANFYKVEGWVDNNHSINVATVEGGTLSASVNMAEEGTEITLTATPDEGYAFNNDWAVTNAETSESIIVRDGKFIMPAANVNVTASFGVVPFLNASADVTSVSAKGGTVTITVNTNAESWTAKSDNAAFVVGTTSGNTVDVVVSANTDATVRTATITISAGSLNKEINLTQAAASTGGDPTEQTIFLETFGSTTSTPSFDSYTGYSATADMFAKSGDINTHYSGNGKIGKNNLSGKNLSTGYTGASGLSGCYHTGVKNTETTILQISDINIAGCKNISISFGAFGGSTSHKVNVYYKIDGGAETALIANGAITNANWTLLSANISETGSSLTLIFKHKPTNTWLIRMDDIKVVGTK